MSIPGRARKLANASPLIASAVERSVTDDAAVVFAVEQALKQLSSAELLRCFSFLLDDDPTSELFTTARCSNDDGRRAMLVKWLREGDVWPDEVLDTAYSISE